MNENPTHEELLALWNVAVKFIKKHDIGCAETIYQSDWVFEDASEFVENVCNVVGYWSYEDEE
jgi:hypothetical protein